MPIMEWIKDYELGIDQFDNHHKHLVSLINTIYDDYTSEAPTETVGEVLNELIDYVAYHFSAEESWMENIKYPDREKHIKEHNRFSKTILEMQEEYTQGKMNLSFDLLVFLKTWLNDHITETDAEYGHYIATKRAPISLV